jgi:hypothetical protein
LRPIVAEAEARASRMLRQRIEALEKRAGGCLPVQPLIRRTWSSPIFHQFAQPGLQLGTSSTREATLENGKLQPHFALGAPCPQRDNWRRLCENVSELRVEDESVRRQMIGKASGPRVTVDKIGRGLRHDGLSRATLQIRNC